MEKWYVIIDNLWIFWIYDTQLWFLKWQRDFARWYWTWTYYLWEWKLDYILSLDKEDKTLKSRVKDLKLTKVTDTSYLF